MFRFQQALQSLVGQGMGAVILTLGHPLGDHGWQGVDPLKQLIQFGLVMLGVALTDCVGQEAAISVKHHHLVVTVVG